jgi:hypothetical protein
MAKTGKIRNSKWGKTLLAIFISIIVLVTGLTFFLLINAEKIINNNLSDYVFQKTDSLYRLEFEDIDLKFSDRSISFSKVYLQPDTTIAKNSQHQHYEFETNSLVISGIKLDQLFNSKIFSANSLKVHNPIFRLSTGQDVDIETFTAQKIETGDSVNLSFLREIFIDTILITDARMKIDTLLAPGRKAPKVNLEVLQFKLGGRKMTPSPFPFDVSDIRLKIENLQEKLSDKIHLLQVEEVSLSLLHSRILAKNILLKPYADSLITNENQYRIMVPEMEIISPYVERFYMSDTIPISKLTFQSPEIEIRFGTIIREGTPLNAINLYQLIKNDLSWINIDEFAIVDARLKLYPSKNDQVAQELEHMNITFSDFRIDQYSYSDRNRILSAMELEISIDKYALNHVDKVHQLVINNFKIDTKSKKASTGVITFRPINTSRKLISAIDALVDIRCKGATLKGVKFGDIYHRQLLPMDELLIHSPEVVISLEKIKKQKQQGNEMSLIFQKTKDYVRGIYVKKTVIDNGKLNYNYISDNDKNGFFMAKFRFELTKLSVDSATLYQTNKIFFADNFDVKFSDIGLQLADDFHRLMTDSLLLSSKGKLAEVYNLKILPIRSVVSVDSLVAEGHSQIFDVSFPKIELFGTDLHKAIFQKELIITEFNVLKPSINIDILGQVKLNNPQQGSYETELYKLISDYLFSIKIEKLRMKNGELNISQLRSKQPPLELSNSFSVEMTRFEIDSFSGNNSKKIFFSDDIDLILNNYSFALADGVHNIDAQEIGILSSEKRIYIKAARMYPDISAENFKKLSVTTFATLPEVQITGADIHRFLNKGEFPVHSVSIEKPVIKLLFRENSDQKRDSSQQPQFTLKGLDFFSASQIGINNGFIELANYQNMKSKTFATSAVDFKVEDFKIVNENASFKTNYRDFSLSLKNTSITIPDKLHQIDIKQANYLLSEKLLKISSLSFKPGMANLPSEPKTNFNFNIPTLTMTGFDLIQYLEKKEIAAAKLSVTNPVVEIEGKRDSNATKFDPYRMNLFGEIKDFISKIDVENVDVTDATLKFKGGKTQQFDHLSLKGSSFFIDKNSDKTARLFSFGKIHFETSKVKGKTNDGFYNYGIERIAVNDQGEFSLQGISFTPAYPEAEFNRRKDYQEDYITVFNANCTGNGFDIKRLIEKDEISIGKARIDFDRVDIYRNNHFPLPEGFKIEMPQKGLRELKTKFNADTISISCDRFNYRELEPQASSETKLFFSDINASISNLTNIESNLQRDPYAHLLIDAKLMGTGDMRAKINLNILSPENRFDMVAECGPLPLIVLNSVTEPSMRLSIREGRNDNLYLFFEADEDSARGEMKFAYSDLKISIFSEKEGVVKEEKFISFLANTLAVKSDNPKSGKILLPVPANTKRDKQRSFINYCWRSAFTGIKNTFGMKEEEPEVK